MLCSFRCITLYVLGHREWSNLIEKFINNKNNKDYESFICNYPTLNLTLEDVKLLEK